MRQAKTLFDLEQSSAFVNVPQSILLQMKCDSIEEFVSGILQINVTDDVNETGNCVLHSSHVFCHQPHKCLLREKGLFVDSCRASHGEHVV